MSESKHQVTTKVQNQNKHEDTGRVMKNVQMQGASFDKLRINSPEEWVVHWEYVAATRDERNAALRLCSGPWACRMADGRFSPPWQWRV